MPGTGKTSFLGLLFVALVNNDRDNGPTLTVYDQDRAYLNRIAHRLQMCELPERTQVGDQEGLNLVLALPGVVEPLAVSVPDLSGETWEAALLERLLSESIWNQAANSTGFIVFANATNFQSVPTVEESRVAALDLGLEQKEWNDREPSATADGPSASQVALVDMIQILAKTHDDGPFRLSLILSAYDAVASTPPVGPHDWVVSNAPLLAQFLDVNADTIHARIFGVSAQGGDYSDQSSVDEIAERPLLERAFVREGTGTRVGFHEPLLWALGDA